jgi:hypothetical protein
MSDQHWTRDGRNFELRLAADLGYTPIILADLYATITALWLRRDDNKLTSGSREAGHA